MSSDLYWIEECNYLTTAATKKGKVKEMNFDTATFVRYCEMVRDMAARENRHDTVQYVQHILDDLKE